MNNHHHDGLHKQGSGLTILLGGIAIACLLIANPVAAQDGASTSSETGMKQTDVGGLRLAIETEKSLFRTNESIIVSISITNLTDSSLYVAETGPEHDFEFIVKDGRGRPAQLTDYGQKLLKTKGFSRRVARTVEARQSVKYQVELSKLYEMTVPATYTVTAKRRIPKSDGELISNTLRIEIEDRASTNHRSSGTTNGKVSPDLTSNTTKFEIVPAETKPAPSKRPTATCVVRYLQDLCPAHGLLKANRGRPTGTEIAPH